MREELRSRVRGRKAEGKDRRWDGGPAIVERHRYLGRLRAAIADGVILPACVYVGTHIEEPGRVVQKGGTCKIICGPDPLQPGHDVSCLLELLDSAGIRHEWSIDPYPEIWGKFVFIASFGLVTACHDATLGQVLESAKMLEETKEVMKEIFKLAVSSGVGISPAVVDDSLKKAAGFPHETKTSFQRDFENKGKDDERDLFGGTIIRLGEEPESGRTRREGSTTS